MMRAHKSQSPAGGQILLPVAVAVEAIAAVSDAIGRDGIPLHAEEGVPVVGIVQVKVQRGQASVSSDPQGECIGQLDIAILEGAGEQFKVIRKPQVVVLHVGHVRAARLAEGTVPVFVAKMRSFGKSNRRIHTSCMATTTSLEWSVQPSPTTSSSKSFQRLRQNRMDCHFEDISAVVGWQRTLNSGVRGSPTSPAPFKDMRNHFVIRRQTVLVGIGSVIELCGEINSDNILGSNIPICVPNAGRNVDQPSAKIGHVNLGNHVASGGTVAIIVKDQFQLPLKMK